MLEITQLSIGGKVIRLATGTLGSNGAVRGRPPIGDKAKHQVTLRLDPDVLEKIPRGRAGLAGSDQRGVAEGSGVVVFLSLIND